MMGRGWKGPVLRFGVGRGRGQLTFLGARPLASSPQETHLFLSTTPLTSFSPLTTSKVFSTLSPISLINLGKAAIAAW